MELTLTPTSDSFIESITATPETGVTINGTAEAGTPWTVTIDETVTENLQITVNVNGVPQEDDGDDDGDDEGEGGTSGIGSIGSDSAKDVIYNLQGVRVNNPVRGQIYIINGKKVVVK